MNYWFLTAGGLVLVCLVLAGLTNAPWTLVFVPLSLAFALQDAYD